MKVKDFLEKKFLSGGPDTNLRDILKKWTKTSVNVFIVEDEDKKLLGIVTIYDLLKKILPFYLQVDDVLSDFAFDDLLSVENVNDCLCMTAGEVMTEKVITVGPEDNFLKAATEVFSMEFDYLPVVYEKYRCVGILTRDSLEKAILSLVISRFRN